MSALLSVQHLVVRLLYIELLPRYLVCRAAAAGLDPMPEVAGTDSGPGLLRRSTPRCAALRSKWMASATSCPSWLHASSRPLQTCRSVPDPLDRCHAYPWGATIGLWAMAVGTALCLSQQQPHPCSPEACACTGYLLVDSRMVSMEPVQPSAALLMGAAMCRSRPSALPLRG